ncbi:MBL fold metallo-hydrolase [Zooshikella harenae]|uniref:MBL fold metallo-hydrolase n=1 Tax=Zooshikella harenae TaxID=2827238 RepID=A0ABS5Z7K8_9GAMM|nr:MBL fold metallo-hydrolase [Zooshikella harenae]MBU2710032.1 MBL fold metallo-hydrolase [Zooshikella harenae]
MNMKCWVRWLIALSLIIVGAGFILAGCSSTYQGPVSDHFDGTYFYNIVPTKRKTLWDIIRWRWHSVDNDHWQIFSVKPTKVKPARINSGIKATFINHATVLIQQDKLNILTDPIWSERCSPVSFIGPKRYHPPALAIEDLPPIDVVIISHNHYDHLDLPTLVKLDKQFNPRFVVGLGNGKLLRDAGINKVYEVDWWQTLHISSSFNITGVPAQHWSTRTRFDMNRSLWLGFVLKGKQGTTYFSGDTGIGPHFELIKQRFKHVNLALLPIGAYLPRWFMADNHLSPKDALSVHQQLAADYSMAIHFRTFDLGDDGQYQAADELTSLLDQQADELHGQFIVPKVGEQLQL